MVDSEEEYYPEEINKLKDDVEKEGMGLIVFGEWYNVDTMIKMKFFDDNTRSWWTPVTGASFILLPQILHPHCTSWKLICVWVCMYEKTWSWWTSVTGTSIRQLPWTPMYTTTRLGCI